MNYKNAICLSIITMILIYSINLHITLEEVKKENKALMDQNDELKKHIEFMEDQIEFKEDEISFLGHRCDSLINGIKLTK